MHLFFFVEITYATEAWDRTSWSSRVLKKDCTTRKAGELCYQSCSRYGIIILEKCIQVMSGEKAMLHDGLYEKVINDMEKYLLTV